MVKQDKQDLIWQYYQSQAESVFDLSYPRLRFLAERCPSRMRVLNIGVGSGYLEKMLIERGVEVYSLDPCAESIARLQVKLNMGERARQGYSHKIPFDTGSFDKVIMTEVLEHLTDEAIYATLTEVHRVLKPCGEFTGTVPYCEDLQSNAVFCPYCQVKFHRWGHLNSFNTVSFGGLLKKYGFCIKQIYPRTFPDFRRPGVKLFLKAIFRYILGRIGEQLVGPNLYFVSKKN